MAQLAIYIDEELTTKLDRAVEASGKSRSRWVVDVIKEKLQTEWPDGFFDLAGSWEGEEGPEELMRRIRTGTDVLEKREGLVT